MVEVLGSREVWLNLDSKPPETSTYDTKTMFSVLVQYGIVYSNNVRLADAF